MLEQRLTIDDEVGPLELTYLEWPHSSPDDIILCVHGLTRNAHDFETLAERLASRYRILSVNLPGRGGSGWLEDANRYVVPNYVGHMMKFMAALDLHKISWIGTSLGGIIGMIVASVEATPIHRLVLNDVGGFISKDAMGGIVEYLKLSPSFATLDEAEQHLREIHAAFGTLEDAQWRRLAEKSVRQENGRFKLHYDPAIVEPFKEFSAEDVELWQFYTAITCPVLLLHGIESDLLSQETAKKMTKTGPKATLIDYADAGHAPSLMVEEQISDIDAWLAGTPVPDQP